MNRSNNLVQDMQGKVPNPHKVTASRVKRFLQDQLGPKVESYEEALFRLASLVQVGLTKAIVVDLNFLFSIVSGYHTEKM